MKQVGLVIILFGRILTVYLPPECKMDSTATVESILIRFQNKNLI